MADSYIGVYEQTDRGSGFLREQKSNYRVKPTDPFVTPELVRSLGLVGGELIECTIKPTKDKRARAKNQIGEVLTIQGRDPKDHDAVVPFDELIAIDPQQAVRFETDGGPSTMRIIDLMTPIGLGQRGLIVAPPRTGKTMLLQHMAAGVAANHPDVYMMVLLIDERPEEVTDMRRSVNGEVVFSSNDEDTASHVRIARLMIQKARRMVESGKDVFILLDSLTRLARAFNVDDGRSGGGGRDSRGGRGGGRGGGYGGRGGGGGRTMSGGLSVGALNEPKQIFGAARNVEDGGSLTIVASALIETGSRMDDVIFSEFKGTGNMEIMLSREMANRRVWPAIDLNQSGTRKEERLLTPQALEVSYKIRRSLLDQGEIRAMETLLGSMGKFPNNEAFIANFAQLAWR
jgi:transcription termination factor Rho